MVKKFEQEKKSITERRHRCIICSQSFKTYKSLLRHRKQKHSITIQTPQKKIEKISRKKNTKQKRRTNKECKFTINSDEIKDIYFNKEIAFTDDIASIYYGKRNGIIYKLKIFHEYLNAALNFERETIFYKALKSMNISDEDKNKFPSLIYMNNDINVLMKNKWKTYDKPNLKCDPSKINFNDRLFLITTYEGPSLGDIKKFYKNINHIFNSKTICNILIDLTELLKIIHSLKFIYNEVDLDNIAWNYRKNRMVFINMNNCYEISEEIPKPLSKFSGYISKTPFKLNVESILLLFVYLFTGEMAWENEKQFEECFFFEYFQNNKKAEDIFYAIYKKDEKDIYKKTIDALKNFCNLEKKTKYRFQWEYDFKTYYNKIKKKTFDENMLRSVFKPPFSLRFYNNK